VNGERVIGRRAINHIVCSEEETVMRPMIMALCVCAAGCGGQGLTSATSPTDPAAAPTLLSSANLASGQPPATESAAGLEAQSAKPLPFSGKFTGDTEIGACPTCPPTTLRILGTGTGEGTHLGRFTAEWEDLLDLSTASGTGNWDFTAANGDQLFTTTVGVETEFEPPNISHVTETATIVGGTGRFEGATGTFAIRYVQTIDFAGGTASIAGTLDGQLIRKK
jgi:hypothetical protein